jgi:hypothetical protein
MSAASQWVVCSPGGTDAKPCGMTRTWSSWESPERSGWSPSSNGRAASAPCSEANSPPVDALLLPAVAFRPAANAMTSCHTLCRTVVHRLASDS